MKLARVVLVILIMPISQAIAIESNLATVDENQWELSNLEKEKKVVETKLKENIALKKTLTKEKDELENKSVKWREDANTFLSYCTGEYFRNEYEKRKAKCSSWKQKLDLERKALKSTGADILKRDKLRHLAAIKLTQRYREIQSKERAAVLIGYAFKMGAKIRAYAHSSFTSMKDISRVMIGLWHAERGSYQKARHLAFSQEFTDEILKEMDNELLSLEREQRKLLEKAIPQLVISGDFDGRLFSRYPDKFSLSLLRAHLNIKSHNYDEALKQIAIAKDMNIEAQSLADAEVYVRQMLASDMGKLFPSSPALIAHQRNLASAYAGWTLATLLMDAGMDDKAIQELTTSSQTMEGEGDMQAAKDVFSLAKSIVTSLPESNEEGKSWIPLEGIYDHASEADILLDSMEYGRGDWNQNLLFLKLAQKAAPNNKRINKAIAHVQALMASQR